MRRIEAMLVVIALLAAPFALLACGMACESSSCTMMFCMPHGSHSHAGQSMACHCPMRSQSHMPDFSLADGFAPTAPSAPFAIASPEGVRGVFSFNGRSPQSGFASAPFQPPRA